MKRKLIQRYTSMSALVKGQRIRVDQQMQTDQQKTKIKGKQNPSTNNLIGTFT